MLPKSKRHKKEGNTTDQKKNVKVQDEQKKKVSKVKISVNKNPFQQDVFDQYDKFLSFDESQNDQEDNEGNHSNDKNQVNESREIQQQIKEQVKNKQLCIDQENWNDQFVDDYIEKDQMQQEEWNNEQQKKTQPAIKKNKNGDVYDYKIPCYHNLKKKFCNIQLISKYTLYETQEVFIQSVIESILNHQHIFIESPTGTGKTLSLLLSTLSFYKFLLDSKVKTDDFQIYYCSRTHTQLKQVMQSLATSPYGDKINSAILGAREKMCINQKVITESHESEVSLDQLCALCANKEKQNILNLQSQYYEKLQQSKKKLHERLLAKKIVEKPKQSANQTENVTVSEQLQSPLELNEKGPTIIDKESENMVREDVREPLMKKEGVTMDKEKEEKKQQEENKQGDENEDENESELEVEIDIDEDENNCEYLRNMLLNMDKFKKINMLDIEELKDEGQKSKFCPYFLMRNKIQHVLSQITLIPYQYIFNYEQCEFIFGKKKKGIIIFDEAHNIAKDAEQSCSTDISLVQLQQLLADSKQMLKILLNDDQKQLFQQFQYLQQLYLSNRKFYQIEISLLKYLESIEVDQASENIQQKKNNKKNLDNGQQQQQSPNKIQEEKKVEESEKQEINTNDDATHSKNPDPNNLHTKLDPNNFYKKIERIINDQIFIYEYLLNLLNQLYKEKQPQKNDSKDKELNLLICEGENIFSILKIAEIRNKLYKNHLFPQKPLKIQKKQNQAVNSIQFSTNFQSFFEVQVKNLQVLKLLQQQNPQIIKFRSNQYENFMKVISKSFGKLSDFTFLACSHSNNDVEFKWACLNPQFAFQSLNRYLKNNQQKKNFSYIFTSGSLAPMKELAEELGIVDDYTTINDIQIKSLSHISTDKELSERFMLSVLLRGPMQNGKECFNFQYNIRNDQRRINKIFKQLALSLLYFRKIIQGGIVLFFASYDLQDKCIQLWRTKQLKTTKQFLFNQLEQLSPIFIEEQSDEKCKATFAKYSQQCKTQNGAILLANIRGRLSEGIDFKDELARAIFIIGLPNINSEDAYVKQKQDWIKKKHQQPENWFQTQSIRAMNQAIGRIIRNREDYGAVYLVDERFQRSKENSIQNYISDWAKRFCQEYKFFPDAFEATRKFFQKHTNQELPNFDFLSAASKEAATVITKITSESEDVKDDTEQDNKEPKEVAIKTGQGFFYNYPGQWDKGYAELIMEETSYNAIVLIENLSSINNTLHGQQIQCTYMQNPQTHMESWKIEKQIGQIQDQQFVGYIESSSWSSNFWFYPLDKRVIKMKAVKIDKVQSKCKEQNVLEKDMKNYLLSQLFLGKVLNWKPGLDYPEVELIEIKGSRKSRNPLLFNEFTNVYNLNEVTPINTEEWISTFDQINKPVQDNNSINLSQDDFFTFSLISNKQDIIENSISLQIDKQSKDIKKVALSIVDAGHYIPFNSDLYKYAQKNLYQLKKPELTNSFYNQLNWKMFPEEVSKKLSFNENSPRLAISAVFKIENGNLIEEDQDILQRTFVKLNTVLKYEDVNNLARRLTEKPAYMNLLSKYGNEKVEEYTVIFQSLIKICKQLQKNRLFSTEIDKFDVQQFIYLPFQNDGELIEKELKLQANIAISNLIYHNQMYNDSLMLINRLTLYTSENENQILLQICKKIAKSDANKLKVESEILFDYFSTFLKEEQLSQSSKLEIMPLLKAYLLKFKRPSFSKIHIGDINIKYLKENYGRSTSPLTRFIDFLNLNQASYILSGQQIEQQDLNELQKIIKASNEREQSIKIIREISRSLEQAKYLNQKKTIFNNEEYDGDLTKAIVAEISIHKFELILPDFNCKVIDINYDDYTNIEFRCNKNLECEKLKKWYQQDLYSSVDFYQKIQKGKKQKLTKEKVFTLQKFQEIDIIINADDAYYPVIYQIFFKKDDQSLIEIY